MKKKEEDKSIDAASGVAWPVVVTTNWFLPSIIIARPRPAPTTITKLLLLQRLSEDAKSRSLMGRVVQ